VRDFGDFVIGKKCYLCKIIIKVTRKSILHVCYMDTHPYRLISLVNNDSKHQRVHIEPAVDLNNKQSKFLCGRQCFYFEYNFKCWILTSPGDDAVGTTLDMYLDREPALVEERLWTKAVRKHGKLLKKLGTPEGTVKQTKHVSSVWDTVHQIAGGLDSIIASAGPTVTPEECEINRKLLGYVDHSGYML
jgi:hypothetical protein